MRVPGKAGTKGNSCLQKAAVWMPAGREKLRGFPFLLLFLGSWVPDSSLPHTSITVLSMRLTELLPRSRLAGASAVLRLGK